MFDLETDVFTFYLLFPNPFYILFPYFSKYVYLKF